MGKEPNLYSFDPENEFLAITEENAVDTKFALNSFVAFAKDKEEHSLGYINLSVFIQNWNASSKCNKIILAQEEASDKEIGFYLNGFDSKGKKAPKGAKSNKLAIEMFYKSLFPKENDAEAIKFSVSTHTTFFIEINDRSDNDAGEIIAAVTFLYDEKRENAMILWLGVLDQVPKKYKDTFIKAFGTSLRRKGFSTILIMAVIKWCKVINTTKLNLWLQVSDHSVEAKLFYEAKGFYYKGMNKDDIAESLRELLNKSTWINQSHMMLYCCNDGFFITNDTFDSSNVEMESVVDNQVFVKEPPTPSETAAEVAKMESDEIMKQAEDSKANNIIKVTDSQNKKIELDLNQEDRIVLIEKIKSKDPEFDPTRFIYLTMNNKSGSWYRKKLASQSYIMYPARSLQIKEHGTIAPEILSNLLLQYPMLKEYMKCNNPGQTVRAHEMKTAFLTFDDRKGISDDDWLQWDPLQILLNIFVDFGGCENVAIIPAYTAAQCKEFIEMKNNDTGFYNSCERYNKYKQVVGSIPPQMRKELLNKRLIVYVNNESGIHWTCTFLFNLGQYIKNFEDCKKDMKQKIKRSGMEPSGYLHYDPYSAGTQYKKPPFNCGLLQFLNIIYDHCWQ